MNHRDMNDYQHSGREFGRGTIWRFIAILVVLLLLIQGCDSKILKNFPGRPGVATQVNAVGGAIPSLTTNVPPSFEPTIANTLAPIDTPTPEATLTSTPQESIMFAVIGDYGSGKEMEGDVAKEVIGWNPDFIITLGDNNYPKGAAEFIDTAVGQFYHSYIYPYKGKYGEGAEENRFFPSLGNHDLDTNNGQAYYDYFELPGNERYYDFVRGPVHFFALDSMYSDPDGATPDSKQAMWLKDGLAKSTSAWNVVYFHYSPYTSGHDGPVDSIRWPFKEWGADIVFSGHDHDYERLNIDGLTYIVNGLGGGDRYDFKTTISGSEFRYNADWGAMKVEVSETNFKVQFITRAGEVIDTFDMNK